LPVEPNTSQTQTKRVSQHSAAATIARSADSRLCVSLF
jgi:hypothetical protein